MKTLKLKQHYSSGTVAFDALESWCCFRCRDEPAAERQLGR